MRRAALAAAVVGLALAALGGGVSAADAGRGNVTGARLAGAATSGCQLHRHSKRFVHRVRRHGKLRTVRGTRHWWSCNQVPPPGDEAAPTSPAPTPAATPAPSPGPVPTPEPEPELEPGPSRLSVKAAEYSYTLSRQTLTAGEVTIELDNRGQDAHNLNLRPVGSEAAPLEIAETESLQRSRAHFTLEPGVYRLWCSLPTHDEEGMHATLVVEAP